MRKDPVLSAIDSIVIGCAMREEEAKILAPAEQPDIWIVGRIRDPEKPREWEFMGVFDSFEKADAACTEYYDFIGPTVTNRRLQDEPGEWPNCTWPRSGDS